MPLRAMQTTTQALREARVATRPLDDIQLSAILHALLTITDHGVLITDLEHHAIACNGRFGEIFLVNPDDVPYMGVEELRGKVYPRLSDPEAWRNQLNVIYAQPELTHADELELTSETTTILRRVTGPFKNADGKIIGRVWTFEDITGEKMRQRRREASYEVSTFHHPDPAEVCRHVTQTVADVYDSMAILSIQQGRKLLFREVANAPEIAANVRENTMEESYCQVALRDEKPLLVQDARLTEQFSEIMPARLGYTRYLGVPICSPRGKPYGTLCIISNRSDEQLDDEDIEFMSVMANRLSTELERERLYEERTAEQRQVLDRQSKELALTQEVLSAMNQAFQLLEQPCELDELLQAQSGLLSGLLDYDSVALLQVGQTEAAGYLTRPRGKPQKMSLNRTEEPLIFALVQEAGGSVSFEHGKETALAKAMGGSFFAVATLPTELPMLAIFARRSPHHSPDEHHLTHLTAVIDQIALLLTSHRLQQDLRRANKELKDAQARLIQSEKLSVVGALSASVAHDIRNIMAAISLECSSPTQDAHETLAKVKGQVERFSVLSHRLLSYARPKFIARESTSVNELIERALAMLSPQIAVSGVETKVDLGEDFPAVIADSHRVEHLLVNLMLNALHAMSTTGGVLTIKTWRSGDTARVTIEDNGRGIPGEVQQKIFEPFYSSRADGFGLGLYSCRQIATEHGWQIRLESSPGQGALFTIEIPLEKP